MYPQAGAGREQAREPWVAGKERVRREALSCGQVAGPNLDGWSAALAGGGTNAAGPPPGAPVLSWAAEHGRPSRSHSQDQVTLHTLLSSHSEGSWACVGCGQLGWWPAWWGLMGGLGQTLPCEP